MTVVVEILAGILVEEVVEILATADAIEADNLIILFL